MRRIIPLSPLVPLLALVPFALLATSCSEDPPPPSLSAAPTFELPDLAGNRHSLTNYRGKIVLLDFWASWCRPCSQLKGQLLKPLYNDFGSDDRFELISIGTAQRDNPADQRQVIQRGGYEWLVLHDEGNTAFREYNIRAMPHLVLIDEHGQILGRASGSELVGPVRNYLRTRLAEQDLAATEGLQLNAPQGAESGSGSSGGPFDTTQVIVLVAVIALVVFLSVRDKKKEPASQQQAPPPSANNVGSGGPPEMDEPASEGNTPFGQPPSEEKPRSNFMGGNLGNN